MYLLYSLVTFLFVLLVSPYFLYQAVRYRKYVHSLSQRLGYLPVSFNLDAEPSIWIHAVSVGEVLTARPLIADLRETYPNLRLFLSTTTMAGHGVAKRNVRGVDAVFYFPFDWSVIVRRTLRLVRPELFVMMETEIWPNLLRECQRSGVKTILVNGRISSRSYPRYRLVRRLFRHVLANVDRFCVQNEESRRRLIDLGAASDDIVVTGSLKFDSLEMSPLGSAGPGPASPGAQARVRSRVLRFFRLAPGRPVVVAGSTMREEDRGLTQAFKRLKALLPDALLILAPRHPERFGEAVHLAQQAALVTTRRTELPIDREPRADVVVLDSIGELAQVYQLATVVFVGGSLVDMGGHNILEPAVFGKPIVFGPYMQNFAEIAESFLRNDAAVQVPSGDALYDTLASLMTDSVRRARLGAAARALVESNRGARQRTLDAIVGLLPPTGPAASGQRGVVMPFRPARS